MFEVAGLDVEIVRLQIAVLRRKRVEAVVGKRHRLRMLQFGEDARLEFQKIGEYDGVVNAGLVGGVEVPDGALEVAGIEPAVQRTARESQAERM